MRHTRTSRLLVRTVARGRRSVRAFFGHGELPAPIDTWRSAPSAPGAVALVGDSLASRFPASLLDGLQPSVLRRGWAGETAAALRTRIDEVLERDLAVVVLQTGTNDLLRGASAETLLATHAGLVAHCRASAPDAELVLLALPPITPARVDPRAVVTVNAGLRSLAADAGATFVDTYAPLARTDGTPTPGTTTDGVHLTLRGYRAVATLLRPHLGVPNPSCRTHPAHHFPLTLSHQT